MWVLQSTPFCFWAVCSETCNSPLLTCSLPNLLSLSLTYDLTTTLCPLARAFARLTRHSEWNARGLEMSNTSPNELRGTSRLQSMALTGEWERIERPWKCWPRHDTNLEQEAAVALPGLRCRLCNG
jgi:hypothetical protein